jgi:hypothetical protein
LFFFRIRFFPAWIKVVRHCLGMKPAPSRRNDFPKSSLEQPDSTGLVIHLHTPSKEYLENQSQNQVTPQPQPPMEYLADRFIESSESNTTNTDSRASSRQDGVAKRSLSIPFRKDKSKKPSVEDILAMRRMGEFGDQGLTYPGVQPVVLSGNSRAILDV